MTKIFKRSYRFAFKSSMYITSFLTLFMGVFLYMFYALNIWHVLLFAIACYVFSFFIIKYRVEHFIYKRVKKIYDDLTLLESKSFSKDKITTDMATLTQEIDKYARDKKLEIETLKIREEYRKEFIGNVSHELKTPLFTVQGYISTLLDGAVKDKNVRTKFLKKAAKSLDGLDRIVQDLLTISQVETGVVKMEMETQFSIFRVNVAVNFQRP